MGYKLEILKERLDTMEKLEQELDLELTETYKNLDLFKDVNSAEEDYQEFKEEVDIVYEEYLNHRDVYLNKYILMHDMPKLLLAKKLLDNLKKNLCHTEDYWGNKFTKLDEEMFLLSEEIKELKEEVEYLSSNVIVGW